jgi:hypothetical protein
MPNLRARSSTILAVTLITACASIEPEPVTRAVPPPPVSAFAPPEAPSPRKYSLSSDSPRPVPGALPIAQETRPDACEGTDQPAIVDLQPASASQDVPVWTCFDGCGPGLEYVTNISRRRGRTTFSVRCRPVCAADEHRVSYATVDDAASCAPGAPRSDVAQRLAAEQARELAAFVDARARALDSVDLLLRACERAKRPWDEATLRGWEEARHALLDVLHGGDGRDLPSTAETRARVEQQRELRVATSARAMQASRVRADKLGARLEALRPLVAAVWRRQEIDRDLRLCSDRCDDRQKHCLAACRGLRDEVCATCELDLDVCRKGCAERAGRSGR